MKYKKIADVVKKWNISPRGVRLLRTENRRLGVVKIRKLYRLPVDANKYLLAEYLKRNLTNRLTRLFISIDAKKKTLDKLRPLTTYEIERLHEEFLIDFTYNSNAIEGNTLTLKETSMVLKGINIDQKTDKEHLEIIGHKDAFLYVLNITETVNLAKEIINIEESIIKNIHSLVLLDRPQDKGVYRRIPVKIIGAIHIPPQPYAIEYKMERLLQMNQKNKMAMHVIERIARFHLEFEGIHPFIDGNGRTGRLIINLDLIQNGFPPISIKFTDRHKYYDAFDAYYISGDASKMIELIAFYVEEALNQYLEVFTD